MSASGTGLTIYIRAIHKGFEARRKSRADRCMLSGVEESFLWAGYKSRKIITVYNNIGFPLHELNLYIIKYCD